MTKSNTLSDSGPKLHKFRVKSTWIYLTERCNLHCDYCFFRHMHGRDVSLDAVEQLFLFFEREANAPSTLIFSGGEAFLARANLFKISEEARCRFPGISLHIQTNGSLINDDDIVRLKDLGISLEFGIDGDPETTIRHRCGLNEKTFEKLAFTIGKCVKAGIKCGSTMTVHPHEAERMEQGLEFLRQIGMPHVDVTPAAFMPWTPESVAGFKKNYLQSARKWELRRLMYANEDNDPMSPGIMDLSLHPPGYLLGGDAFLCLPENKRIEYDLWDHVSGRLHPHVLSLYQEAYAQIYQKNTKALYREHVCRNFELVNEMMGQEYINTWAINDIMHFLTKTHLALGIRKWA